MAYWTRKLERFSSHLDTTREAMGRNQESEIIMLGLSSALGEAVLALEQAAGVPRDEQIGFSHLFGVPESFAQSPLATGPKYLRRFTSAPMPMQGYRMSCPAPPRVPVVPDSDQLAALLDDHQSAQEQTSAAERRLVRCHLALMDWLKSGRLRAWGHLTVQGSGGRVANGGRQEIAPNWWPDASLDYLGPRGRAPELRPEASAWRVEAAHRIGSIEVSGPGCFSQISVDKDAFLRLMDNLAYGQAVFRLERPAKGARKIWIVRSRDAHFEIEAEDAVLIRGLRSLAVLLANPNKSVPFHLLEALARKDAETRPAKEQDMQQLKAFSREVRVGTGTIAEALFQQLTNIDDRTKQLVGHLRAMASQAEERDDSPLIRNFGKEMESIADGIEGHHGKAPRSMSRVSQAARDAIEAALNSMDQAGRGILPSLGEALRQRLTLTESRYTLAYRPSFLDPTWSVV